MLRSYMVFAGVAAGALGLSMAAINCGGSTDTNTGGSSTTGTGAGTTTGTTSTTTDTTDTGTHAQPPGPPTGAPAPDGTADAIFAISKLYLGDADRDGTPNKVNGWKNYGFDIDQKISTATSTDLCKPQGNTAPKNVYPDGNNGIDNSFGKSILPIILTLSANVGQTVNDDIAAGKFTIMFSMKNLGTGNAYSPILTGLYGGGDLTHVPKFDGSDKWPVFPELLDGDPPDISKPKVHFDNAYITGNTWVSGGKGSVDLNLSVQGITLTLTIGSAQIAMELSDDHKSVKNGTIAGVLETAVLLSELKKVAGGINPSYCSIVDNFTPQIAQASDIMKDGSQDPTKTCDGISIGLGFDALPVQLGDVLPASPTQPNPCP